MNTVSDYLNWWARLHTNVFAMSLILDSYMIEPPFQLEIEDEGEKMRFEKEYVGSGNACEELYRVKDCENEIPLKTVFLSEKQIDRLVEWLNENVNEMSLFDIINLKIRELWNTDEIIIDDCLGYVAITEIKETDVSVHKVNAVFKDFDVDWFSISFSKSVYKIKKW